MTGWGRNILFSSLSQQNERYSHQSEYENGRLADAIFVVGGGGGEMRSRNVNSMQPRLKISFEMSKHRAPSGWLKQR